MVVPGAYCVYVITNGSTTYNGSTNNPDRRLRQHNGEIAGGARSTKGRGPWRYVFRLWVDGWSKTDALSAEWHIRYPTGKKPRPREFCGPEGRIRSLELVIPKLRIPDGKTLKAFFAAEYECPAVMIKDIRVKLITELGCNAEERDETTRVTSPRDTTNA